MAVEVSIPTERRRWRVPCVTWPVGLHRRIAHVLLTGQRSLPRDGAGDDLATSGAARGFDALFEQYERQVFGYLWRITGDQQLASDLSQETFLRAWQHFDRISTYQSPIGWLLRVATNLALNAQRRRFTRVGVPLRLDAERSPAASDPAARVALDDLVHRTLLGLPTKMRAGLVLREVYGLSFEEVARTLNLTHAAAKMLLSRAREQFCQRYRREEGQP
jgi:RNA polymerase sigma-70 factor, ECF subfamily